MALGCLASAAATVSHTHPPRSVPSSRLRVTGVGPWLQSTYRPPDQPLSRTPAAVPCPASFTSQTDRLWPHLVRLIYLDVGSRGSQNTEGGTGWRHGAGPEFRPEAAQPVT